MSIAVVLPTYNRLHYTKLSLARLLSDKTEDLEVYIWDNASTDGTRDYLKNLSDPRIKEVVFSKTNVGATAAMNQIWEKSTADLLGKVDNDCLVTPGWTRALCQAHVDIPKLGAVALWHFPPERFEENRARRRKKIQKFAGHEIMRHPWVCGSGFLMKRETFLQQGKWKTGSKAATTDYFIHMALEGWVNGWYFPLILQEHMDNPLSSYSVLKDDRAVKENYDLTFSLKAKGIKTLKHRVRLGEDILSTIMSGTWDARYYVGIRGRIRKFRKSLGLF